jgi:hypothetical protein
MGFNCSALKRGFPSETPKELALSYLDEFLGYLEALDLQVVAVIAQDLKLITESIRTNTGTKISKDVADKISKKINRLDPALDAEMKLKSVYLLTKKRFQSKHY